MFVEFDPEKHRGKVLYEFRTVQEKNDIATILVPSEISYEEAAQTPWYYLVKQ